MMDPFRVVAIEELAGGKMDLTCTAERKPIVGRRSIGGLGIVTASSEAGNGMRSLGHRRGCRLNQRYDWMSPRECLFRVGVIEERNGMKEREREEWVGRILSRVRC